MEGSETRLTFNRCIENAWHIFVLIGWIEKRLVDLIILKKHPTARRHFSKTNKSPTLGKERQKYWRDVMFKATINEFFKAYPEYDLPLNWRPLLENLNLHRDVIAHGHFSLNRDYAMFAPQSNKRKGDLARMLSDQKHKPIKKRRMRLWQWRLPAGKFFYDSDSYEDILKAILEFDTKLFPHICANIGIDYEKIK